MQNMSQLHTRQFVAFAILLFISITLLQGCSSSPSGGTDPTPLAISTTSLPSGQVGAAYSTTLGAAGGTPPFTWATTSGTLPAGLILNASTGAITGTPTASASNLALTFQVKDSGSPAQAKTAILTLTISPALPTLVITTASLPNGQVGSLYSTTLAATGGMKPYTWTTTSGTLPAGLALNASTGAITGTPTATATNTTLTFQVKDSGTPPQTKTVNLTLTISPAPPTLTISTTSLPNGQVGSAYSATLAATGGTTPYAWSLISGMLPTGLTLTGATGAIAGTPTVSVINTPLMFQVKDSGSPAQSKTVNLTLTIMPSASIKVSISPKRGGLTITQSMSLAATTNDPQGVTWTATGGSFSAQTPAAATYIAPKVAGTVTVTATSVTDGSKSATATIGVTDLAGVFTYHNNLSRDGSNPSEYALTPSNVSTGNFGKLFSCPTDGAIYAQPLWVANLNVGGKARNVVFAATQHEGLYAFDADANPCVPLWKVSLIDAAHGGTSGEQSVPSGVGSLLGSGDITPEVGVTGTPVIDPTTNTLFVVSKSVDSTGTTFYQRLHGIDLFTGNELNGNSPVLIAGTYPGGGDGGTVDTFNPKQENQRPGLALVNGAVYIAWASHGDIGPFYGWVISYDATSLTRKNVLNVAPNYGHAGIWMSGGAPAADSNNNIFLLTGNGMFDVTNSTIPNNDYGDSFLKLSPSLGILDYFTPSDQLSDNANDNDFGSGGAAILVDLPSGTPNHFVIGGGKDGFLYLLNRDSLGGSGDTNAWQYLNFSAAIFATGAFWNNTFYLAGVNGPLNAFAFNTTTRKFGAAATSLSPGRFGFPGSTPSVSSQGSSNGIVWALDNGNYCTPQSSGCGPAVLHAYDASSLANELWNSSNVSGDAAGNAVKFTVPTVANGKVYVGTRGNNTGGVFNPTSISGELDVYGLLP